MDWKITVETDFSLLAYDCCDKTTSPKLMGIMPSEEQLMRNIIVSNSCLRQYKRLYYNHGCYENLVRDYQEGSRKLLIWSQWEMCRKNNS